MPLTAQLGNDDGHLSVYNVCVESNKRLSANTSVSGNSTHAHTHNSLRFIYSHTHCWQSAANTPPHFRALVPIEV